MLARVAVSPRSRRAVSPRSKATAGVTSPDLVSGSLFGRKRLLLRRGSLGPRAALPLVVINVGTGPAFDLSVRWSENPAGDLLARTPMLGVNGRLEWSVPVGPGSDENQTIRRLWLDWCDSRSRRLVGHPAPCRACAIDAGPDAVVRYSSRTVVRVKLQHK